MQIGPYQLDNNLWVAPMAGVTDRPFRQLCRRLGAGMAVSEMISSDSALRGTTKTVRRLDFTGEPGPISVQILGADPYTMAEAAKINVGHGAQIIDINMGCPARKVCKVAAGSALLMNPPLARQILEAVVQAVEVPVTLKIRTGWDQANRNGLEIARIAEASGIAALAIHGRTRACGYSAAAEYETIRSIKQGVRIPIIANGDIDSPEKAKKVLELTGADAIMIGRATQGRPWIFREIAHYLKTGGENSAPQPGWIRDILLGHLENLYAFYGEFQGVRIARKHIAWYSKTQQGGALFRQRINTTDSAEKQQALVTEFFDQRFKNKERAA